MWLEKKLNVVRKDHVLVMYESLWFLSSELLKPQITLLGLSQVVWAMKKWCVWVFLLVFFSDYFIGFIFENRSIIPLI